MWLRPDTVKLMLNIHGASLATTLHQHGLQMVFVTLPRCMWHAFWHCSLSLPLQQMLLDGGGASDSAHHK